MLVRELATQATDSKKEANVLILKIRTNEKALQEVSTPAERLN